jgi:hypothetical protein
MSADKLDLKAIRQRANAATPGPWVWRDDDMIGAVDPACPCAYASHEGPIIQTDSGVYGPCIADREFIAHARTDIPALLTRVAQLEALVKAAYFEGLHGLGAAREDYRRSWWNASAARAAMEAL